MLVDVTYDVVVLAMANLKRIDDATTAAIPLQESVKVDIKK